MKYFTVVYLSLFLALFAFSSFGSSNDKSKTEKNSSKDDSDEDEDGDSKKRKLSKEDLILGTWEASINDRKSKIVFKNGGRFSSAIYEEDEIIEKGTGEYEIIHSELILTDERSSKPEAAKIISINDEKLVIFNENMGKIVFRRID